MNHFSEVTITTCIRCGGLVIKTQQIPLNDLHTKRDLTSGSNIAGGLSSIKSVLVESVYAQ